MIQTSNLTKEFGELKAVNKVNFNISTGIVYGLLGPNGAGKTTLIRLLNGLLEPTSGKVLLFGKDVQQEGDFIRSKCGVQTDTNLYESLTARENLEIWGKLYNIHSPKLKGRVESLLKKFGLYERRNDLVSKYSRGMKQKLLIARALIHKPEILFLDEPTAGLDPDASEDLLQYLKKYVLKNNKTVFLSTHRLEEAELLAEEIGIINRGKILVSGSLEDLAKKIREEKQFVIRLKNPKYQFIKILKAEKSVLNIERNEDVIKLAIKDENEIPEIIKTLVKNGADIIEIFEEKHTLKDIYFSLVPKKSHEY